jgi:hypothetical protein
MAQAGRIKNLEPARPLKSTIKQTSSIQQPQAIATQPMVYYTPTFEVQTIDDLISLTETVASALQTGNVTAELINKLSANLCIHGPQLELISKDTLDRAFIIFRNASQDDRLKITVRLTLLQLIELRANSWQISDGLNTYYKHKATNVEPETDLTMLSTSPSSGQILAPGELVKNSGKFSKPTKIPGKNYSKDEIVIRNADSGKVMGIKGRRVHMIEELSDTIISFQRVNVGAKERLVQITGPTEEKINYAKQLIEDTIRRNASPVRLETNQDGSCSSLASSVSDDQAPRTSTNRNSSIGASIAMQQSGPQQQQQQQPSQYVPQQPQQQQQQQQMNHKLVRSQSSHHTHMGGISGPVGQTTGGVLIHSLSTSDASLGEYKYTVNVGPYNIKITGDCFDLVRAAKLVLDDYFSSKEFLESSDAAPLLEQSLMNQNQQLYHQGIPATHQLAAQSLVDSGVSLDLLANHHNSSMIGGSVDIDDDVFVPQQQQHQQQQQIKASSEEKQMVNSISSSSTDSSSSSNTTIVGNLLAKSAAAAAAATAAAANGLNRSKRTNFLKKESTPESSALKTYDDDDPRIVHDYENLLFLSKSPQSKALPANWSYICEKIPSIVKQETTTEGDSNYFDGDQFLEMKNTKKESTVDDDDIEIINEDD